MQHIPFRSTMTICAAMFIAARVDARAQQTIFNVPSADVLDRGKLYLETDQYLRFWDTDSDEAAVFLVRGVVGLGGNVEVGLNTGTFDYLHRSAPFVDAAIKWRPVHAEIGAEESPSTVSLIVGDHLGYSLRDGVSPRTRNFAYAAGAFRAATQTRIGAGAYHVTKHVFTDEDRFGVQLTAEQPVRAVKGLTLAADWFSGDGGYLTAGLFQAADRFTFYAGYGFANTGRDDDLLTLELGVVLF